MIVARARTSWAQPAQSGKHRGGKGRTRQCTTGHRCRRLMCPKWAARAPARCPPLAFVTYMRTADRPTSMPAQQRLLQRLTASAMLAQRARPWRTGREWNAYNLKVRLDLFESVRAGICSQQYAACCGPNRRLSDVGIREECWTLKSEPICWRHETENGRGDAMKKKGNNKDGTIAGVVDVSQQGETQYRTRAGKRWQAPQTRSGRCDGDTRVRHREASVKRKRE